ncbi:DUF6134 family protein [Roseateles chitinivorans]|uniref:DUF6134 family protein n=1 Tax=Roseateles chitinivorans TaxID=2917965 RepID=UPI003D66ECCD
MTAASSTHASPMAARVAAVGAFMRVMRVMVAVSVVTAGAAGLAASARAETWNFEVRLDGKPIGTHRFTVDGPEAAREVTSIAAFDVKLLGITVFRYRHEARERWRGDCLQEIRSRTDDDGKPVQVDRRWEPTMPAASSATSATSVTSVAPVASAASGEPACLMSYAYWHPGLIRQQRLLNPQTGEVDEVRIERLPDATVPAGGRDVDASRWRITSTATATSSGKSSPARQVLTLWRDRADGRWIGLDAQVKGDRVLSYRLP